MVANILSNGITLRDYTKTVEKNLREGELNSIQVCAILVTFRNIFVSIISYVLQIAINWHFRNVCRVGSVGVIMNHIKKDEDPKAMCVLKSNLRFELLLKSISRVLVCHHVFQFPKLTECFHFS